MSRNYSTILLRIKSKFFGVPKLYKEHYARILFVIFLIMVGGWLWIFYSYAWRSTVVEIENGIVTTTIPEDLLGQVLEDIEIRERAFENPVFESVRDPFHVFKSEELVPEE